MYRWGTVFVAAVLTMTASTSTFAQERFWTGASAKGNSWEFAGNWNDPSGLGVPGSGDNLRLNHQDVASGGFHTANYTRGGDPLVIDRAYGVLSLTSGSSSTTRMTFRKTGSAGVSFTHLNLTGGGNFSSGATAGETAATFLLENDGFQAAAVTSYRNTLFDASGLLNPVPLGVVETYGRLGLARLALTGGGTFTATSVSMIAGDDPRLPASTYPSAILHLMGATLDTDDVVLQGVDAGNGWSGSTIAGLDLESSLATQWLSASGGVQILAPSGVEMAAEDVLVGGLGTGRETEATFTGGGDFELQTMDIQGDVGAPARFVLDHGAMNSSGLVRLEPSNASSSELVIEGNYNQWPPNLALANLHSVEMNHDSTIRVASAHANVEQELRITADADAEFVLGGTIGTGSLGAGSIVFEGGATVVPSVTGSGSAYGSRGPFSALSGDFRTRASGDWNDANVWEVYDAGVPGWSPATSAPGISDTATVLANHSVTVRTIENVNHLILECSEPVSGFGTPQEPGEVRIGAEPSGFQILAIHGSLEMRTGEDCASGRINFAGTGSSAVPQLAFANDVTLAGELRVDGERGGWITSQSATIPVVTVAPGAVVSAAGGSLSFLVSVEMDGTMRAEGVGTISLSGPSVGSGSSGSWEVTSENGALNFQTFAPLALDSTAGRLLIEAGALHINQPMTFAGGLHHSGGTIEVSSSASLTVTGRYFR